MSDCLLCGAFAPDDKETGYRADSVCPACQRELDNPSPERWQSNEHAVLITDWPPVSAQGNGDPGPRVRCGWCCVILTDGTEPETTGICESCYQKQLAALEAECPL